MKLLKQIREILFDLEISRQYFYKILKSSSSPFSKEGRGVYSVDEDKYKKLKKYYANKKKFKS